MKKILVLSGVIGAIVLALGVAGFASAQIPVSTQPLYLGDGSGYFGGFGRGGRGSGMVGGYGSGTEGPIHDYMMTELAQALGLESPEELESRLEAGDTLWVIAQEQEISADDFRAIVLQARTDALNSAVADQVIDQDQADWMLSHMNQGWANGYGPGSGNCDGTGLGTLGNGGQSFHRNAPPNR